MSKLLIDSRPLPPSVPSVRGWYRHNLYGHDQLSTEPNRELTHVTAKAHADVIPAIINLEHWPLPQQMRKYIQVIEYWREVRPDTRLGYYSMLPVREYWAPIQEYLKTPVASEQMAWWRQQNAAMARGRDHLGQFTAVGLVDVVDFVCPSIYAFYPDDQSGPDYSHEKLWLEAYAPANIAAARNYQKQVYPFIWPRLHYNLNYIGDDFLRKQIALCVELADGCIVWDGVDYPGANEVLTRTSKIMQEFV